MKKFFILLALTAIIFALSCNKQEEYVADQDNLVTFTATLGDAPAVKTVLQNDGSVFWSPGNAINLFYGDAGSAKFISDCTEPAVQTNFTGSLDGFIPNGSDDFWAVYPYDPDNSFDGTAITLSLPEVQTGVAGTFADDLYISMARTKDYTLHFYNVCGGIKFSVANEGIKYVTFRGNADEVLAGQVNVAFNGEGRPEVVDVIDGKKVVRLDAPDGGTFEVGKWYYIVTLPATLNSGYTMSFYSDQLLAERSSDKKVTIKRSVWGKLTDADDVEMPITPNKYLTFTSEGTTTISLVNEGGNAPVLYYSTDTANWTRWDYSGLKVTKEAPLYLCGENPGGINVNSTEYSKFVFFGDPLSIVGDIMSLINCDEAVTVIPNEKCFMLLFSGCSGLKKGPSLPATELTESCYNSMYSGCSGLTVAPELPAMVLKEWCYAGMFEDCTSLLTPPELPARSLAKYCYDQMFFGCSNMAKAPTLPATSMAQSCYAAMFAKCSSLETAPALPALTLAYACYESMFIDCVSLTDAPELPATSLTTSCYQNMFLGCESLSIAPVLPATSLAERCYYQMFEGCINLSEAPDLPAAELSKACYSNMFFGCSNLKYVKCLATDISAGGCLSYWLSGTNASGTFVKAPEMNDWPTGSSGIPEGWTVVDDEDVSFSPNKYLTFTSEGTTSIALTNYSENAPVLYYSLDRENWTLWDYSELTITSASPIYICGDNPEGLNGYKKYSYFTSQGSPFGVSGSIMSLINCQEDVTVIPCVDCFYKLFQDCENLVSAPELPATTLADYCYCQMFIGCSGLLSAPTLPATVLAPYCYERMFYKCSSLTEAPVLPATTLETGCYRYLFRDCSSLGYVKCLATDISAANCVNNWVSGVPAEGTFVKTPEMNSWPSGVSGIPEGWIVKNDGEESFAPNRYLTLSSEGVTVISLENYGGNAPVLYYSTDKTNWSLWNYSTLSITKNAPVYLCGNNPDGFSHSNDQWSHFYAQGDSFSVSGDIMSLIDSEKEIVVIPCSFCFFAAFSDCAGLISAPTLPATTLAEGCYESMFEFCNSLVEAPALPARTLTKRCYYQMFYLCSSLVEAPALPATNLASSCYYCMFQGCTFSSAPELPATILTDYCYYGMFDSCRNLDYVKCLAADISATDCITSWLWDVSLTGDFIKNPVMNSWPSGSSGIPTGWTVQDDEASPATNRYLTFTSEGTTTISLKNYGGNAPVLYYSTNTINWFQWDYSELTFTSEEPVFIYGDNPYGFSKGSSKYSTIMASGSGFSISGDIMSLIDNKKEVATIPCSYCFNKLFYSCKNLTSAPQLTALSLTDYCYASIFYECIKLVSPPDLPATDLADHCYSGMFAYCKNLTAAPELPALQLATYCYTDMFLGCDNMLAAPSLPALTMEYGCYAGMFGGCSNLTEAPDLHATKLAGQCYSGMFGRCSNLAVAPDLPAQSLDYKCYEGMFFQCIQLKTPPDLPALSLSEGCYSRMFGGCKRLLNAPLLPATTLAIDCYSEMFSGCSSLVNAPTLPALELATYCYKQMFKGCSSLLEAPALPATKMTIGCYWGMFGDCSKLISAPSLPSIQLEEACYLQMFQDCSSLINPPSLPAVSLKDYCYSGMFVRCSSLEMAPELPSTTMTFKCYSSMFSGCTSLVYAPDLPATTLANYCYENMFSDCSNLSYVKSLAMEIIAERCIDNWLKGVSSIGTFVKAPEMNSWPSGVSGIPEGWTVLDAE